MAQTESEGLDAVYAELVAGRGREHVSDANVAGLIERARAAGNAQLELLLREWRSECGEDPEAPTLAPELPPPSR